MSTQQNHFPKLHNAMWPGLVGKGSPGAEPCIDLDTMLDLTANASVNGVKFDGVDIFLIDPHVSIDISDDGLEQLAAIGLHAKQRLTDALNRLHHVVEMKLRTERLDLRQQRIDQPLRRGFWDPRYVIDRLLGIKRCALPAGHVEGIDDMAIHLQHAAFEDGKKPDRPCADDADIRLVPCR